MMKYTDEPDNACALEQFLDSLELVRGVEAFSTADLQRHLMCRYGLVRKVLSALCELCVIEPTYEMPNGCGQRYVSLICPSRVK